MHAALAVCGLPWLEIQNRSADGNTFASKREIRKSNSSARLQHRNRAVRSSKIDAEEHLLAVAGGHRLIISFIFGTGSIPRIIGSTEYATQRRRMPAMASLFSLRLRPVLARAARVARRLRLLIS